jgi:hypothetical protein
VATTGERPTAIEDVIRRHEARLLGLPNVTSVGIRDLGDRRVVVVFVSRKVPESELGAEEVIPRELDGFQVMVEPEIRVGSG